MKAQIEHGDIRYEVDLDSPIHLSFPIHGGESQLRAWWVDPVTIEPVSTDEVIYSVAHGSPVNFRNIFFNPHGHGTHTECVGHITAQVHSINDVLRSSHFMAKLVSIRPEDVPTVDGSSDRVLKRTQFEQALGDAKIDSLVVRTLPNDDEKMTLDHSGTNPPYLEPEACRFLRDAGIKHLLLDLPSVDREHDGGVLAGHKAFWGQPGEPDLTRTITELIFVPNDVPDGLYLLELQIAPFANDASPSRPILYALNEH